MTVKLGTEYSEKQLAFLKEHNCMFVYGGAYIGEIKDEDGLMWSVLSKFKGNYHWGECYEDSGALEDGF